MTAFNAETMHRLAKLALDSGEVSSPEEALQLFSRYRLRIHLGVGWANTLAGQACFLTALNAAMRAFLGGVEVRGDLSPILQVPLYRNRSCASVVEELGGTIAREASTDTPTIIIGAALKEALPAFCVRLSWDAWCASLTPASESSGITCIEDNPLAGIAAAALGVNEAFLHIRGDSPDAGRRSVNMSLWQPTVIDNCLADAHRGPALQYLPSALWLIGLGHLGQAYAWTLGMLPYPDDKKAHLVLQDFDKATQSNLSTSLLLRDADLGKHKARLVSERMEHAGFTTDVIERRFASHHHLQANEPTTALFGVDNVTARRDLETAGFAMVVEAGLGSGYRDFRNMRLHTFPGNRKPTEIWTAADAIQTSVHLNDTYKKLAQAHNDLCGMTLLASRAVATPFVGALAAALALAEVIRPSHGGVTHAALDVQMKSLRHRTGAEPQVYRGFCAPYVPATYLAAFSTNNKAECAAAAPSNQDDQCTSQPNKPPGRFEQAH